VATARRVVHPLVVGFRLKPSQRRVDVVDEGVHTAACRLEVVEDDRDAHRPASVEAEPLGDRDLRFALDVPDRQLPDQP
jgi:hypothetical protein